MNNRNTLRKAATVLLLALILLAGCYTFMSIEQPNTVVTGQKFTAQLVVRTEPDPRWGLDTDPKNQIICLKIPVDWTVDSVYFRGDRISPTESSCTFLPFDQPDAYPSKVDYWTQELEERYPTPANMEWQTYQSDAPILPQQDTTYNNLFIEFTVGDMEGDFDLGYFVSNAALDFDQSHYYDISLVNTITVTGVSAIADEKRAGASFSLAQNYPNPFNPVTTIHYVLSGKSAVQLRVFSLDGQEVARLVDAEQNKGAYSMQFRADGLASGIYVYRLQVSGADNQTGIQVQSRKMMLIR